MISSKRSRIFSGSASWAAVVDAQTVSPPTFGTSRACRTVKAGGASRNEKSLCHTPPKLNASASVASLTTLMTSGCSGTGWTNGTGEKSPSRWLNSACWPADRFCSGTTNTSWSQRAFRNSVTTAGSMSGASCTPSTRAPRTPVRRETSMPGPYVRERSLKRPAQDLNGDARFE